MNQPHRLQIRRGQRHPENTKSVKRPTRWGNPFKADIGHKDSPEEALVKRARVVEQFARWLENTPEGRAVAAAARELRGFNLACACPLDGPCHGEILLRIANEAGENDAPRSGANAKR